jgi:hypothetical protein
MLTKCLTKYFKQFQKLHHKKKPSNAGLFLNQFDVKFLQLIRLALGLLCCNCRTSYAIRCYYRNLGILPVMFARLLATFAWARWARFSINVPSSGCIWKVVGASLTLGPKIRRCVKWRVWVCWINCFVLPGLEWGWQLGSVLPAASVDFIYLLVNNVNSIGYPVELIL